MAVNNNGFTLVELMVAMVVGSIAIASAYASYDVIAKPYEKVKGVTAMQSSSRSIMRMVERGIRMTGFKWHDSKTKLDQDGKELPDSAIKWACVRDKKTNLVWEVKDTIGLRANRHTYTWYKSNPDSEDLAHRGRYAHGYRNRGRCSGGSGCDTEAYTSDVNAISLCGSTQWRMPSIHELRSLVLHRSIKPMIDTNYFPNTYASSPSTGTWSDTWAKKNDNGSLAYIVRFYYSGSPGREPKGEKHYVRLVQDAEEELIELPQIQISFVSPDDERIKPTLER